MSFSEIPNISGIYAIHESKTNKVYVGSALDLNHRLLRHRSMLRGSYHCNPHMQSAYNLYGEPSFYAEVLEFCEASSLIEREDFWMSQTDSIKDGYNMGPAIGNRRGSKFTEEQRKRVSDGIRKAHLRDPSIGKRSGMARIGIKNSKEHVAKVAAACAKDFKLKSPDGVIFTGRNRAEFCRKNGLNKGQICMLINGHVNSAVGWTRA